MKVNIVHPKLQKLYGIKDTDEFEVASDYSDNRVLLKNGWVLKREHVNEVKPFDLEQEVDRVLAEFLEEGKAFTIYDFFRSTNCPIISENFDKTMKIIHDIMMNVNGYLYHNYGGAFPVYFYYPENYDLTTYTYSDGSIVFPELIKFKQSESLTSVKDSSYNVVGTVQVNEINPWDVDLVNTEPVLTNKERKTVLRKFLSIFGY